MLDVLGLDPADPAWATTGRRRREAHGRGRRRSSPACSSSATEARGDKDFARADAIRDQLKAAGIEIEDTPDGPKWSG